MIRVICLKFLESKWLTQGGPIQGKFGSDKLFLHLFRYIHISPEVWCTYSQYFFSYKRHPCRTGKPDSSRQWVENYKPQNRWTVHFGKNVFSALTRYCDNSKVLDLVQASVSICIFKFGRRWLDQINIDTDWPKCRFFCPSAILWTFLAFHPTGATPQST